MPVKIRLSRVGKKHAPFYRIVSVDSRRKRDSSFLEDLGTYDALNSVVVRFDEDGYNRRIEQGAIPTDSVKKIHILFKKGVTEQALKEKKAQEAAAPKAAPKKAKPAKAAEPVKEEVEVSVQEETTATSE